MPNTRNGTLLLILLIILGIVIGYFLATSAGEDKPGAQTPNINQNLNTPRQRVAGESSLTNRELAPLTSKGNSARAEESRILGILDERDVVKDLDASDGSLANKRLLTYRLTNFLLDSRREDENEVLFPEYELGACDVSNRVIVPRKSTGTQNLNVTIKADMPLWEWLNSNSPAGTPTSPYNPPCVVTAREDNTGGNLNGTGGINWTNKYTVQSRVISGSEFGTYPIQLNGIICQTNDFYADCNAGDSGSTCFSPTQFISAMSLNQSSKKEVDALETALVKQVTTDKAGESGTDSINQITPEIEYFSPDQYRCKGGRAQVTALYKSDVMSAPSITVNNLEPGTDIENIMLPLARKSLANAYVAERLTTLNAHLGQRVIHRNALGVEITYTVTETSPSGNSAEEVSARGFNLSSILAALDNRNYQEEIKMTYPYLGQLREINKRLSVMFSDEFGSYEPGRTYEATLGEVATQIRTKTDAADRNLGQIVIGDRYAGSVEEVALKILRDDFNLMYCGDLDRFDSILASYKNVFSEERPNSDSHPANVYKRVSNAINTTDCIAKRGEKKWLDPLQVYLCSEGLLAVKFCQELPQDLPPDLLEQCRAFATRQTHTTDAELRETVTERLDSDPNQTEQERDSEQEEEDEKNTSTGTQNVLGAQAAFLQKPTNCTITQGFHRGATDAAGNVIAREHPGIDCSAGEGTDVKATAGGIVLVATDLRTLSEADKQKMLNNYSLWSVPDGGYGQMVLIQHSDGLASLYAHLSVISVRSGQEVAPGQLIGKVGTTGNSSGPHLHFELRKRPTGYFGYVADPNLYYNPACVFQGNGCTLEGVELSTEYGDYEGNVSGELNTNSDICRDIVNRNPEIFEDFVNKGDPGDLLYGDDDERLRYKILNMCPFDFSSYTLSEEKIRDVVNLYGEFNDERGPFTIDQYRTRLAERTRRAGVIVNEAESEIEKAQLVCTWFAETGASFGQLGGIEQRSHGLGCGVDTPGAAKQRCPRDTVIAANPDVYSSDHPRKPNNFDEEVGCLLNKDGVGGETGYCKVTSITFNPNQPGEYMEKYGPVSDGNAGFADKYARCLGEILEVPRAQPSGGQTCYEYPYEENPYNFIYYDTERARSLLRGKFSAV